MSTAIKGVIFDLDGVIFDSQKTNVDYYNFILESIGLAPKAAESADVIHKESMEGSLRHLIGDGPKFKEAMRFWEGLPEDIFVDKLQIFPQAVEIIELLHRHFKLAVATNRSKSARPSLRMHNLAQYFQSVVTPTEVGDHKPHPEFARMAMRELGLTREQVVYVGDSTTDEQVCLATGVSFIAFRNPELKAWKHIDGFDELPGLLGIK